MKIYEGKDYKMTGKKHFVYGICNAISLCVIAKPTNLILGGGLFLTAAFGSLLPDIDSQTSLISNTNKLISYVCNKIFGHRGFLHSPACVLLLWLLGTLIIKQFPEHHYLTLLLQAFLFGYTGHLFLDMLTKGGIPFFYPLSKKKVRLSKCKTGGKGEIILFILAILLLIVLTIIV